MRTFLTATILTVFVAGLVTTASADGFMRRLINGGANVKGSGKLTTEDREVPEFNKIRSSGAFDIHVTIGTTQRVTITFDDNLVELVKTEVKGKTLRLYTDDSYSSRKDCRIEITVPELVSVDAAGSGNFTVEDLKCDAFEYEISGSGDARIGGDIGELDVTLSGSGNVTMDGHANMVDITVSGSGGVDASELIADDAAVRITGSGDVSVHARKSFDGRVSGSGDIDVYGKPPQMKRRVSGSGDISSH